MIAPNYTYQARGVKTIDGDTIDVDVDLGFHLTARLRLRLNRINTYELTSSVAGERELARQAKGFVASVIDGTTLMITTQKADAFGRYLADVWYMTAAGEQINLNDTLIDKGLATLYARK